MEMRLGFARTLKSIAAMGATLALALALAVSPGAPAQADALGGPITYENVVLEADDYFVCNVWFEGGVEAAVMAAGTGDIDIYILDPNGELLIFDAAVDNMPIVGFTPEQTGLFTIALVNAEGADVRYDLWTT